jgi:hypothetical protein
VDGISLKEVQILEVKLSNQALVVGKPQSCLSVKGAREFV